MNLLQIVQEFCDRTGLRSPAAVVSTADTQVRQLRGLLNEFMDDLVKRKGWQVNTREAVFVSVAGEDQGLLSTLCPYGFNGILPDTFFNRTQRLPMRGGISADEWQARKAFNITGPMYQFRLRNNKLLVTPALPAGHTIAFEYNSSWFVVNNTGTGAPYRQYWAADTDTCLLDDSLPLAWLRWAWKKEKGLEYAEDFLSYERLISAWLSRDKAAAPIDISGGTRDLVPGIFVPSGNWMT